MQAISKRSFLFCLALIVAGANATATGLTYLVVFDGTNGSHPSPGLLLSSNTLYGEAASGVFSIHTDGTGFTNLNNLGIGDGPLVLSDNVFYGTTVAGGTNHDGTVFAVNSDGTGFTNIFTFNDGLGMDEPIAGVVLSSNRLYGTTEFGSNQNGSVFAINTDGTGFTNLYSGTFQKGVCPHAGLVISGNTLYGAMSQDGPSLGGTVFAINTDGTGFTNIYSFPNSVADGTEPLITLLLSGNTLYGTTYLDGSQGSGTIFRVNTDGTGFSNLYNFPGGALPVKSTSSLVLSGNTLYGGASYGIVFAINTDGTGFRELAYGGSESVVGLVLSGHTLYGVQAAGSQNQGTVFALNLPPPNLNIQLTNNEIILNWNDPTTTYSLQAAPSAGGIYTNVVGATNPFTNAVAGLQGFFRLQSN